LLASSAWSASGVGIAVVAADVVVEVGAALDAAVEAVVAAPAEVVVACSAESSPLPHSKRSSPREMRHR
jgi:hypothetical protein